MGAANAMGAASNAAKTLIPKKIRIMLVLHPARGLFVDTTICSIEQIWRPDYSLPSVAEGAYQMGELQARSWMVAGTSAGGSAPRRAASQVVQRGVGI